jgi:hypothetical protein
MKGADDASMKNVLIIANLLHASPRIPGLVKYLGQFGWRPIVLTSPLGDELGSGFGPPSDIRKTARIIETTGYARGKDLTSGARTGLKGSRLVRSLKPQLAVLYDLYRAFVTYPDPEASWKPLGLAEGGRILKDEKIDAIISSSSPITCHTVAKELKRQHQIPWIADLRDPWSQNHNFRGGRVMRFLTKKLELRTLGPADALVTTSSPWAERLGTLHRQKPVHTITNGFDPDQINSPPAALTENLTITYTGHVYPGRQDPSKLIRAVRELIDEGTLGAKEMEIRFFGPASFPVSLAVEDQRMEHVVRQHDTVTRETSIAKQRESQVLLLMDWEDQKEKGVYTLKVFEYLAARRLILATGGPEGGVVEKLLEETGAGQHCRTVDRSIQLPGDGKAVLGSARWD